MKTFKVLKNNFDPKYVPYYRHKDVIDLDIDLITKVETFNDKLRYIYTNNETYFAKTDAYKSLAKHFPNVETYRYSFDGGSSYITIKNYTK